MTRSSLISHILVAKTFLRLLNDFAVISLPDSSNTPILEQAWPRCTILASITSSSSPQLSKFNSTSSFPGHFFTKLRIFLRVSRSSFVCEKLSLLMWVKWDSQWLRIKFISVRLRWQRVKFSCWVALRVGNSRSNIFMKLLRNYLLGYSSSSLKYLLDKLSTLCSPSISRPISPLPCAPIRQLIACSLLKLTLVSYSVSWTPSVMFNS